MIIEARHLTKSFGECTSFADVSLKFAPGQITAVLGENGAGKSTLMKVLFGLHSPSLGKIAIDGEEVDFRSSLDAIRRGIGMVQQHFTLVDHLSAIDNIMLGAEVVNKMGVLDRKRAIAKVREQIPSPSLEVPWETAVQDLSVGERQKVEILKLLFRESKILFLDEPTAVLTPQEIDELFIVLRQLRDQGRTIVIVTHKLGEVIELCDHYAVLRGGRLVGEGRIDDTDSEALIELMIGRKLAPFDLERLPVRTALALRAQSSQISVELHEGEVLGIAGVNGSGQSQLIEGIMRLREFEGEVSIFDHDSRGSSTADVRELGVALIPEDRHEQGLWLEETSANNMIIGLENQFLSHYVFDQAKIQATTSEWAHDFDVRAVSLDVNAGSLSGGNQQKLIFAREVSGRRPRLLICHQPTRGVDLGAIDLIHRRLIALRNSGLAILLVSSELDELMKLSDRIVVFQNGRTVAEFARADFDRLAIGRAMIGGVP